MREIKFRAWDTFNQQMWGYEQCYKGDLATFFKEYQMSLEGENEPILMQYTGLKDKNGVEIYEGDVVEWYGLKLKIWIPEDKALRVLIGKDLLSISDAEVCEVIGNIYDNPGLLEGKE